MPCNKADPDPPCTPPKPTGSGGACRVDPDGLVESEEDDSNDLQVAKPRRKWNGSMERTLMKGWVTGEKAAMEQKDIDRELFELAREWMTVSKLRKLPCCKGNQCCSVEAVSRVPKAEGCNTCPIVLMPIEAQMLMFGRNQHHGGADWMQLDQCYEHNANSHYED
jgi:hypothetical protein